MSLRFWAWGAVLVAALAGGVSTGRLSSVEAGAGFFSGVLLWTLLEYLMHRFAFHGFAPHYLHHADPADRKYILAPSWLSVSAASLLWMLLALAAGSWARAAAVVAGVIAGYIGYELVHLRIHSSKPGGALLRALRRHHFHHHFANDTVCFGVTSPLWDLVFGSLPARRNAGAARRG